MKQITIAGNIGADAEVRQTQGGKTVTGWRVGVDDGWGENKSTIWFGCDWWGQRGEKVAPYIKKGGKITVTGEFSTREYEGKTYLSINVNDVTLQSKADGQSSGGGYGQQSGGESGGGYVAGDMEDGIPF